MKAPWMERLVTCAIIVSAVVYLFSAGESAAATPGLGAGLPDELGTFNVGHTPSPSCTMGNLVVSALAIDPLTPTTSAVRSR